jgi:hypothetical protein
MARKNSEESQRCKLVEASRKATRGTLPRWGFLFVAGDRRLRILESG